MPLNVNIIIGSTRPGRVGPVIAEWVAEAARAHGLFEVKLVDLADFNLPLLDEPAHPIAKSYVHEHTRLWSESVASADAFVFVTPEYDYFPPASLINAVQAVMSEWFYKPAGFVSYGGASGGLRSAQVLCQLFGNVKAHAIAQVVPIMLPQVMGEDRVFRPTEAISAGVQSMLDELHKWAGATKALRA